MWKRTGNKEGDPPRFKTWREAEVAAKDRIEMDW